MPSLQRPAHQRPQAVGAQPRDPRDRHAEAREPDREVGLRPGDPQAQQVAELDLAVVHRIEQRHRLAGGDDAAHVNGARGLAG